MTDTTTHDLALARAERDAWQTTCEELHHTIARLTVEIESHLADVDAADQRVRTLDAALTNEREAGRGLVAQVEALRAESRHHAAIAAQNATISNERDAAIARAEKAEAEAYTLRSAAEENRGALVDVADDLLVNTVGVTSTDVATRCGVAVAKLRAELAAIRDLAAPGNPQGTVADAVRARLDAVENAQAFVMRERDDARRAQAETTTALVTADRELAKLRAEIAELRARPVLTHVALSNAWRKAIDTVGNGCGVSDIMSALGSAYVLPSPDLAHALVDKMQSYGWWCASDSGDGRCAADMKRALTYLAKLGPAPAREVAPTLVAVSDETLVAEFARAHLECPCDESGEEWAKYPPGCCNAAGIRAVRAKLGAAEVTEERLTLAIGTACDVTVDEAERRAKAVLANLRATAAKDLTR